MRERDTTQLLSFDSIEKKFAELPIWQKAL